MAEIPTAEEMFEANPILPPGVARNACIAFMKTFAKMHVTAALKAASEKANCSEYMEGEYDVNKDSILNSYPLINIK